MALMTKALLWRAGKASPAARALMVANVAMMAGRRVADLDRRDRARLAALLTRGARTRHLDQGERRELASIVAKLEPRALVGDAVKKLSPVPVPNRLAYGKRRRRSAR